MSWAGAMKIRDIMKLIETDGWQMVRQTGSQRQFNSSNKTGKLMEYLVIYEKGPTSWGAYVPDLPGCVAAGESQAEVRKFIEGAIDLHLRGMREDDDPIPEPTAVAAGFVDAARRRSETA
jgi:predicted RNase H-like HicB family nuclease